jgi:hypothetical protein
MLSIDELLKLATKEKKKGNISSACFCLRSAYEIISKSDIYYPVATYLRYPAYLCLAGKFNEAWSYYKKLVEKGYPNQLKDQSLKSFDQSAILDKMRLFKQRQKEWQEAAIYGFASYLLSREAYKRQKRYDEVKYKDSASGLASLVNKLNKKGALTLEKSKVNLKLKAIRDEFFSNQIDRLIQILREIIPCCIAKDSKTKSFSEVELKSEIDSQWLLIPETKAFKKLITLYRKLVAWKTKNGLDKEEDLKFFYKVAILHNLFFETNLVKPTSKVSKIIPKGQEHVAYSIAKHTDCKALFLKISPAYNELGYKNLEILKKTDIKIFIKAWGEPKFHSTARELFKALWQKQILNFEDKILEDNKNFEKSIDSFLT